MIATPVSRRTRAQVFLGACLFFGTSAQLLLKFGVLQVQNQPSVWLPYVWILFGLAVYGLGTGFWMLCLGDLDLSYAYPFTALTYILVFAASWILFEDHISWQRIAGMLMVCLGVALIPEARRRNM